MTLSAFGRAALALGLATTLAVSVDAQRTRSNSNRSDRDTDQSDRNAETETVNRTVALPARGTLKIQTFSGYVHVTGTSTRDVRIKAVRRADRDVLDRIRLTIDSSGSTVTIKANDREGSRDDEHNNVVRTDFDIEMPATATLNVNGFSSPVEVTDVTGELRLETFSGRITVKGARSAVNAQTFNADVDIDLTGAGSSPSLNAHTFSGSIRAAVAESARADVQFHTFSGQFDSDIPLNMRSMRRSSVSGRMGNSSSSSTSSRSSSSSSDATLKFETFSGDVRVVK
jgi:DUF4097 and DUF4098 domain-containing protein YvlB